MAKRITRKQIATAIVKSGETVRSFDNVLALLETISYNECRWVLKRYPTVLAAMVG